MSDQGRHRIRKKRKRRIFATIALILLILIVSIGAYAYYTFKSTIDDVHVSLDREKSEKRVESVSLEEKTPISILLLGVDEREGDSGRSDTMILVTLNPNKDKMLMFNIPRDTRMEIVGKGKYDKINHAYAYGGAEMSIESVEKFLDVPIDYFVTVNMEALSGIVDALGGITVDNPITWVETGGYYEKKGFVYEQGEISLDGPQTLGFVRMRYQDPNGDFGRQVREQLVLNAIADKATSFSSITKIKNLLDVIGDNMQTNMTLDEMIDIQQNYSDTLDNQEKLELAGTGGKVDGIWYYNVDEEEKSRVTAKLKEYLEVE